MKICIIRNADADSNANMMRVVDALLSDGYEITLLSRKRENISDTIKIVEKKIEYNGHQFSNYEIQQFSERGSGFYNIFNLLTYMFQVFKWLIKNRDKFDYIHSFDLDTGLPSLMIFKILRVEYIYHIADFYVDSRGNIPQKLTNIVKKLEFKVINNAALTIICTEERKEQIVGSHPKKLIVIHNTPVNQISTKNIKNTKYELPHDDTYRNDKLKLCYVGALAEPRFINEILKIVSKDERLYLDIAGYGNLADKVSKYSQNHDNICYHGQVDYSESLNLNAQSDVMFAMYDPKILNHRYSAPNKAYEAMRFGKPIIVAQGTGVDSLVSKEKIGIVSNYDINSFKEVINDLLSNSDLLETYSQNSNKAYENYSWVKMKKRMVQAYHEVVQ